MEFSMLKKLILTSVLSSIALGASVVSFAQGVTWTGQYSAYFVPMSSSKVGDGKALNDMYIKSYSETYLQYSSKVVDGWKATAKLGAEWFARRSKGDSKNNPNGVAALNDSDDLVAASNFYVGLENDSVGFVLGTTKYLGDVADMGGYTWVPSTDTGINANTLVDDGDNSSRIGAFGVSVKGLPVVIKAGVALASHERAFIASTAPADAEVVDGTGKKGAEKTTNTQTQFGLLVKYASPDFGAGLQYVATTLSEPEYQITNTVDRTIKEAKNDKTTSKLVVGGNYNLASSNVPLNLWLGVKMQGSEGKSETYTPGAVAAAAPTLLKKEGKDGAGFFQVALGGKYTFGPGDAGLGYAMSTFDKADKSRYATNTKVEKEASETNLILWTNYNLAVGTTVFGTYTMTNYKSAETKLAGVTSKAVKTDKSVLTLGLTQGF